MYVHINQHVFRFFSHRHIMSNICSDCFLCNQSTPLPQAGLTLLISIVAAYGHLPVLQIDTTPTSADQKMLPLSSLRSTTPTTSRHCSCSLLHPLLWNTYAASTAADIYICNIYCCGLYMLHPLLWNIFATSTAVEYVCCIHCCGIYMLHPLWWNTYATSTAVDYICCTHCCGIYLQHPLLWNVFCIHCCGIYMLHPLWWIYGLHPLPWIIRQLSTTSVVSSIVHGCGPVLDFHCCGSGQPAIPVTDSSVI